MLYRIWIVSSIFLIDDHQSFKFLIFRHRILGFKEILFKIDGFYTDVNAMAGIFFFHYSQHYYAKAL